MGKTKRFSKLTHILTKTETMKRLSTLLLALGFVVVSHAQSTDGWISVMKDDFSNNKTGWGENETTVNTSKINYTNKRLVLAVNDQGERRSTAFTKVDFNKDFIFKAKVSAGSSDNGNKNSPTRYGFYIGYANHKYKDEQGWYGMFLNFHEDIIYIDGKQAGQRFFESEVKSASYDAQGITEIGVMRDAGKVTFWVNGNKVYENTAVETSGGAISFFAQRKMKAFLSEVQIFEKAPTPEEVAQEKAIDEAVSDEEEAAITEAIANLEFDTGKSSIRSGSIPALNTMAEMMVRNTKFKVILKGHTDDVGDPNANLKLSQDRVNSVINYLVSKGIDKSRFVGLGYGDKMPIADNDTPEGRQKNRRVEFEIVL